MYFDQLFATRGQLAARKNYIVLEQTLNCTIFFENFDTAAVKPSTFGVIF